MFRGREGHPEREAVFVGEGAGDAGRWLEGGGRKG